jgi:hypothetical protein
MAALAKSWRPRKSCGAKVEGRMPGRIAQDRLILAIENERH